MNLIEVLRRRAANLKYSLSPQISKLVLNVGLIAGYRDYTRFIILTRSRSGSNMLRGLVNSHSQVVTFGEMFKDPMNIGWDMPGFPKSERYLDLFRNDTQRFVDQQVFKKFPIQIKAVGFKIFYYHAMGTELEPIWDYLKNNQNIHVLHLKRQNILKTHLSKKKAELTDHWINLTGENVTAKPIELDYKELQRDFIQTRRWESEADQIFSCHPKIGVIYEKLAHDYVGEMDRIQSFLNLDFEKVKPQTHKQASKPLSESILNYQELKKRFNRTPWEEFFTD